jgi:Putative Flp pilus-assembly TadE/G-like
MYFTHARFLLIEVCGMFSDRKLHRPSQRRGAVLILVAVFMVAIVSCAALSVDLGRLNQEKVRAQAVADAAADAASLKLNEKNLENHGYDFDGSARASALSIAQANGFAAKDVVVNIPPLTGPNAKQPGYAEVYVSSQINGTFSAVLGARHLKAMARSVGAGTMVDAKAGLLVLEPSKKKAALEIKGKSSLLEVSSDILVNSTSSKSVKVGKKGSIKASHLTTSGGIDQKARGYIDAKVTTGAPSTPDPLAGKLVPPPKGESRKQKDYVTSSGKQETYNLKPGNYSELKFDSDDIVNMEPGVYYIDGGEVSFSQSASLNAAGVTIYSNSKKTAKFKTSGSIRISPPTSGDYKGVSLYFDPSKKGKVQFAKGGGYQISGIVYAPKCEVKFSRADVDFADTKDNEDFTLDDIPDEEDLANLIGSDDEDSRNNDLLAFGFSLVARRVSIGNKSTVVIGGGDLQVQRPLRGVVE